MTDVALTRRPTNSLIISEVFGPTVQGEGPSMGRRCAFVRLGHCNLDCKWCDTPYTWDWHGANGTPYDRASELHRATYTDLIRRLGALDVDRVVISGGEPMVQRIALVPFMRILKGTGFTIEVETNGTLVPGLCLDLVDHWNVSPKLAHSGVDRAKAWKPGVLRQLADTGRAAFKFVCRHPSDLEEVAELCDLSAITADQVWIMPEGIDADAITAGLQRLADPAIALGYNVTTRLHVLAWGNTRGT